MIVPQIEIHYRVYVWILAKMTSLRFKQFVRTKPKMSHQNDPKLVDRFTLSRIRSGKAISMFSYMCSMMTTEEPLYVGCAKEKVTSESWSICTPISLLMDPWYILLCVFIDHFCPEQTNLQITRKITRYRPTSTIVCLICVTPLELRNMFRMAQ